MKIRKAKLENINKKSILQAFINKMKDSPNEIDVWSDDIWMILVDKGIVYPDGKIIFKLKNGHELYTR